MRFMFSAIAGIVGPIILFAPKKFIESMALSEAQKKNYYAFLKDVDQHTKVDVTNYIAAGEARQTTIDMIKARRAELGIDAKGKET